MCGVLDPRGATPQASCDPHIDVIIIEWGDEIRNSFVVAGKQTTMTEIKLVSPPPL